jgi:hypothetical protein
MKRGFIIFFIITSFCLQIRAESYTVCLNKNGTEYEAFTDNSLNLEYLTVHTPNKLLSNDSSGAARSAAVDTSSQRNTANLKTDKSFFKQNWFYFIGAAIVAAVVYIVWPEKDPDPKTNSTFGAPLPPK